MATRSQLYKIIAIVILFLVFLQYLYLFPVKLNLGFTSSNHIFTPSSLQGQISSDFTTYEKSLFNLKTGPFNNKKRSPDEGGSTEMISQGANSANNNDAKEPSSNHSRLNLVSILHFPDRNSNLSSTPPSSPPPPPIRISSISSSLLLASAKPASKSQHNNNYYNNTSSNYNTVNERPKNSSFSFLSENPPPVLPTTNSPLPFCPTEPPTLLGYMKVALSQPPSLADIGRLHSDISLGGHYKPPNCTSKDKVALVVPFRDREGTKDEPFNRAMLFNVGFQEANKRGNFDCFIFHDVDLIPENDYNMYNCPVQPRHMSVAVDKMGYKLPYRNLFGGISALTKEHFRKVNGFSNSFWGWGAEDDDMAGRIAYNGLYISRPAPNIARYKMLKHKQQKLNTQRYRVLQKGKTRFRSDGLNNLKYTVEQVVLENTYTLVRVQLAKP
ncbi:hypothetical protein Fcan01_04612 [Folsomia candida]|uniref:Beta-1,4-N-acetylgalactosaminyltransferase n=1 Tax=Folsomia candida TaxID=158441 RepID=A0A226EPK1_FOLCA|nr:hypothetical protein Fcan01_04612 [Folsomia candida]